MPEKKKKPFEFKGHGTAIWIGTIIFTSAWMFVLGIFVGRGTAPVNFDIEKLQKELMALRETVIKEEQKRFQVFTEAAQKKTNLGFYEALKDTAHETELKTKTTEQKKEPMPKRVVSKTVTIPTAKQRPSAMKIEPVSTNKKTDPHTANQSKTGLTIQVASLRDVKIADEMVETLKKKGYNAYRTIGKVPGKGVWYRVRVGQFKTKSEAESTMKRLKKDNLSAYLVRM